MASHAPFSVHSIVAIGYVLMLHMLGDGLLFPIQKKQCIFRGFVFTVTNLLLQIDT